MPAYERAHGPADDSIANRFSNVGKLGIEPLRVADSELELAFARQGDELVGFGERQRNRLLQKYVLAGKEALPRHRIMRRLRRSRDVDRFDVGDGQQLTIIDHGGASVCRLGDFV